MIHCAPGCKELLVSGKLLLETAQMIHLLAIGTMVGVARRQKFGVSLAVVGSPTTLKSSRREGAAMP